MSISQHAPPQHNIRESPKSCTHFFPIVYRHFFIARMVGTTTVLCVNIETPKIAKGGYHYRDNHPGNVIARLSMNELLFRNYPMGVVMEGPPLDHQLLLRCHATCSCASSHLPKKCRPTAFLLDAVCNEYCGFEPANGTFAGKVIYNVTFTIRPRPRMVVGRNENSLYRCASEALQ